MSKERKKISNSLKCAGTHIWGVSLLEIPELENCGISTCGEAEMDAPYEMVRVGGSERQHTTLWFLLDGRMHFKSGEYDFWAEPGDLIIQNSALDRFCTMESGVFHHLFFSFPGMSLAPAVVPAKFAGEIRNILQMLRREALNRSRNSLRPQLLTDLLDSYLHQELEQALSGITSAIPEQAVKLIELDIRVPWTTSLLAEKLNLSVSGLYQKCVKYFHYPPTELIARLKCRRAQYLLGHTRLTLKEIATELGYADDHSFSKAFYKQIGIRPGTARAKLQNLL